MKLFFKILLLLGFTTQINLAVQNDSLNNQIGKNFTVKDGLPSNTITAINQDQMGYLWLATNKGLVRYDGNDFITYTQDKELISNQIRTLFSKGNQLFIGTNKGLTIKTNNTFTSFQSKAINTILAFNNYIYVGTELGIYQLKNGFLAPIKTYQPIDLAVINDLKFDGEFFWIATNTGLWKTTQLRPHQTIQKIGDDSYTSVLIKDQHVIAATYNNGIQLATKDTLKTISTTPRQILSLQKVDEELWVTTKNEGIEVLNAEFNFDRKINKYNTLTTDHIPTVFQDEQNLVWIATGDKGIYQFKKASNTQKVTPKIPKLSFENIEVVYQPIDSIDINSYTKTLILPPNKNHLSFTFTTVNIHQPKQIVYRYKLGETYSPWTPKNSIDFANLQSGYYTFIAQSKVNGKISRPIQFDFFIDKPFYQKAWFITLALFGIVLIVFLIIYDYSKKVKVKVEKLQLENHLLSLEQKALQLQMNPHFIFNVLNGIKALGVANKPKELTTTINKFATLLRAVLHSSRKMYVSLEKEVSTLKNYIELEQQMSPNPFEYVINTNIDLDLDEILIPPMLIQPFVENSIKHGIKSIKNGKLSVNFSIIEEYLQCTIIDNGIGIRKSQQLKSSTTHNSVAVKVTRERVESLSGTNSFIIEEIIEEHQVIGTKVWFKIPLITDF